MRVLRFLLVAVLVIGIGAAGAFGAYRWFLDAVAAPGPLAQPVTLIIQPGTGLKALAGQLETAGVIRDAWMAEIEARRANQARALKPGEYRFDAGISVQAAWARSCGARSSRTSSPSRKAW